MARPFRTFDYDATLTRTFCLDALLPATHPARLLVAWLATLDMTQLYALYTPIGGHPYDPRGLLALWLYAYMTGLTSSRQLETAIRERVPFLYLAAGRTPDHSTLAAFRTLGFAYLPPPLFDDLLTRAFQEGHLTMQAVSHDGTKIHADASKHQAVSYQRAGDLIHDLQQQIEALLRRAQEEPASLSADLDLAEEIALRRARIARLQEARQGLEARADARYQADLAAYADNQAARAERERVTGKQPGGKPPTPPTSGPTPTAQYNFTDPDSRIMKNSTNTGVDQHDNCQLTTEHASRMIVSCPLSHQASDTQHAAPSFAALPAALGTPVVACLDAGYWSPTTVEALTARGITPDIAVGKHVHGLDWHRYYGTNPLTAPPTDASPQVQMAYQLQTPAGQAHYRERKSTVEPVIGIIKEVLGFRQFSLRELAKVQGEWRLVCLAYNLKRYFTLQARKAMEQAHALAKHAQIAAQEAITPWLPSRSQLTCERPWLYGLAQCLVRFTKASCRRSPTGC